MFLSPPGDGNPARRVLRPGREIHHRLHHGSFPQSDLPRGTAQLFHRRPERDHSQHAHRLAAGLDRRPVPLSRQNPFQRAHSRADDPSALRRRDRNQTDSRTTGRAQRAPLAPRIAGSGQSGRLARRRTNLGRRPDDFAQSLPHRLSQRGGRAGQHRSGDGRGGGKSRLHRTAQICPHHPAAHHARTLCRRDHRLHLVVHRTRRAAHVRLHPHRLGAGLQRHQGHRGKPVSLRVGRRDARVLGPALCREQIDLRTQRPCHDGQSDESGRTAPHRSFAQLGLHRAFRPRVFHRGLAAHGRGARRVVEQLVWHRFPRVVHLAPFRAGPRSQHGAAFDPEQPQVCRPRRVARPHPRRGHRLRRGADQFGRTPISRRAGHAAARRAGARPCLRLSRHDAGRKTLRLSQSGA